MLILGTSNLAYIRVASNLARFKIKAPNQLNEGYIATTTDVDFEANRAVAAEDAISTELTSVKTELTELKDSLDPANQEFHELLLDIFENFLLGDIGTMVINHVKPLLMPPLTAAFDAATEWTAGALVTVTNWLSGLGL